LIGNPFPPTAITQSETDRQGQNIRVTREEMELAGENFTNAVELRSGEFLGILDVYHHLHCLVRLYVGYKESALMCSEE
jgi:hypothetical protein